MEKTESLLKVMDRYSRQALFPGIGKKGQAKISRGYAVVVGCGALGSVISTILARAGVGRLRIIDRDFIEIHNLQRQVLFDEDDIRHGLPKAVAAERHLERVNSSIEIEGIVADVHYANIEGLVAGADIILDGLDNLETRFLINDVSLKLGIPWIYGGAVSSIGMTMAVIPGKTPCLRCLWENASDNGLSMTCDTSGVIAPAPFIIASFQAAEAIKFLAGSGTLNEGLLLIDVWSGSFHRLKPSRRKSCPACNGAYEFLQARFGTRATSLCGQNAVQILNPAVKQISLQALAERLESAGKVWFNEFMLHFSVDSAEMVVFPDGRAIVKNTTNEAAARALYSRYIGA
jgi:adenylyltransferase/sulfurtransferase